MRRVDFANVGQIKDPVARDAVSELLRASAEVDMTDIAQGFDVDDPSFTETRTLNVTAPTAANIADFLATFLYDLKRGGKHRST